VLENVAESSFRIMSNEEFMTLYSDRPTGFVIVPLDSVQTSPPTGSINFGEIQQFGSGLNSPNTFIEDISVSDNGLYLIGVTEVPPLRENPPEGGGNELVFFSASNDRGSTFEPARYLVNNTRALTFSRNPIIHPVNDTMLYASWLQEAYAKKEFKLVLSRSLDGGKTFGHTVKLNASSFGSLDMAVSKDGRSLYIVRTEAYQYGEPNNGALVLSKSNDYGKSFTAKQTILNFTGSEGIDCIQIAVQEANSTQDTDVYLAWRQSSGDHRMKVVFSASHNNGVAFSPPLVIHEAYTEDWDCPMFETYGDEVYLAWAETKLIYKPEDPSEILVGDSDIFFAASRDNGRSFESPVNLSEGIGAFTIEPEMLVSEGRIFAVWRETIPKVSEEGFLTYYGNAEVVMTRSLDGGRTFEKPVNLSSNPTGSYQPDIVVHGKNVFVIWLESIFPSDEAKVSMIISNDGGETFGKVREDLLTGTSEPVGPPQILTSPDGQKLYVIWSQRQDHTFVVEIYALAGDII
ncbi:MAG: sialidase family protein, partial [Nitrososphaera sp.]